MWFWTLFAFHFVGLIAFFANSIFNLEIMGGLITYITIFILFFTTSIYHGKILYLSKHNILDLLISIYILWNLVTIVNVLYFDNSLIIYAKGITYSLFPIIGYFIFSFQINLVNIDSITSFIITFILLTMMAILSGIALMIWPTDFYFNFVYKLFDGLITEKDPLWVARLLSYFGDSALVGNISTLTIPLIFYSRKQRFAYLSSPIIYSFLLAVAYTGVILSFARSAWVSTFIITLVYLLFSLRKYTLWVIGLLSFLLIFFSTYSVENVSDEDGYLFQLQERITSISKSFSERYYQIEYSLNIISEHPLGIGLGQAGHKSFSGDKYVGVYDNNYLRIFVELGILGISLFLSIVILSFLLVFRNLISNAFNDRLNIAIASLLFVFYFQAFGSNMFDLHFSSFIFWSLLGILSLKSKLSNLNDVSFISINASSFSLTTHY